MCGQHHPQSFYKGGFANAWRAREPDAQGLPFFARKPVEKRLRVALMIGADAFGQRNGAGQRTALASQDLGAQVFNMFHVSAVFCLFLAHPPPHLFAHGVVGLCERPNMKGQARNDWFWVFAMKRLGIAALCGLVLTGAAWADGRTDAVFGVTIRGISAGTLSVKGAEQAGRYETTGILKSGGLLGLVASVKYTAKASGAVRGAAFRPSRYDEDADTGKRKSRTTMTYSGGVPKVVAGSTGDLSPASQGGTVDPQTAIYAAFRDVDADQVCKLNVQMFDGKRRSQVRLRSPRPDGDRILCNGEYRRLAGFSDSDMAEKSRFPFNLYYSKTADGRFRVERVVTETLYGTAVMTRR